MAEAGPIDPDERVLALQRKAEDKGRQVLIDNNATVRRYFNSASALLKQGRQYHQDGKLEEAFLLFFRFACFFLERLPKHKDYNTPAMAAERKRLKQECMDVLEKSGMLKEELRKRYSAEHDAWANAQAEAARAAAPAPALPSLAAIATHPPELPVGVAECMPSLPLPGAADAPPSLYPAAGAGGATLTLPGAVVSPCGPSLVSGTMPPPSIPGVPSATLQFGEMPASLPPARLGGPSPPAYGDASGIPPLPYAPPPQQQFDASLLSLPSTAATSAAAPLPSAQLPAGHPVTGLAILNIDPLGLPTAAAASTAAAPAAPASASFAQLDLSMPMAAAGDGLGALPAAPLGEAAAAAAATAAASGCLCSPCGGATAFLPGVAAASPSRQPSAPDALRTVVVPGDLGATFLQLASSVHLHSDTRGGKPRHLTCRDAWRRTPGRILRRLECSSAR